MGMPGWAWGLGALVEAPKVAGSWVDLYKDIRDMRRADDDEAAARDAIENLGWAAQETDPRVRLENFREVSRDFGRRPLTASTLLKLQKEIDPQVTAAANEIRTADAEQGIRRFAAEARAAGVDFPTYVSENLDRLPTDALRGIKEILPVVDTAVKRSVDRREAEAKVADTAQFRSTISGLADPSTDPLQLKRFASTGGYDPGGERDILAAAADYPHADPQVVSGAVDDYRLRMTNQPVGVPRLQNLRAGNASRQELVQDYVLGGTKAVGGGVNNHPKQTGAGDTTGATRPVRVSWVTPDGQPNSATISAEDLSSLTASLQAQGVKQIDVVDGKRAVSRKVLIPEKKGRSSLFGGRPGSAPAVAAGQPDLATAKKLVAKYGSADAARDAYARGER